MADQPRRLTTADDVAIHMDLDEDTASQVFRATGGWLPLAAAALRTSMNSSYAVPDLLTSVGLSDFVVSDLDEFDPPLDSADLDGLEVLSRLDAFTETVASIALDAGYDLCGFFYQDRNARTIIDRLRAAGAILAGDGDDCLFVPSLIAAWNRSIPGTATSRKDGLVHRSLAQALTEYIEIATPSDPSIVDNALLLTRSSRAWDLLNRIALAVGFPIFYRHPTLSIDIFATLPAGIRREFPALDTFSALAETIGTLPVLPDWSANSATGQYLARQLVADGTRSCRSLTYSSHQPLTDDSSDPSTPRLQEPGGVLAMMKYLGDHGDHHQAAQLGSRWTSTHATRRPRHLIRLQAATHCVLSGDYGHALALLRGIDSVFKETAVAGDCLQPAVVAWTALASYFAGDHGRTDAELSRFATLDTPPLIMEASFRPAALVAAAYRRLDRLDLTSAEALLTTMKNFPDMGDLWIHVPAIERQVTLLAADSESSLLRADETVEVYSRGRTVTGNGDRFLTLSRAMALIFQRRWRDADGLLSTLPNSSGMKHVLLALNELLTGHPDKAIARADSYHYHVHLDTCARVMLTGLRGVAYLHTDKPQHAQTAFKEAVELSVFAGSLLPIASLPMVDRKVLLDSVSDETTWGRLLIEFGGPGEDVVSLRGRLEAAGPNVAAKESVPHLDRREDSLLNLLAQGKSIREIGIDLYLVEGTVKNRLSDLYRKLGVRNRASAIAKAQALGLLGPSMR